MATKEHFLSKRVVAVGDSSHNQYGNVNLNQKHPCLSVNESGHSNSFSSKSKKVQNYALSKLSDVTHDTQKSKSSLSWKKSSENKLPSKYLNSVSDKNESKEGKDLSKSKNASTLSLHIAAYENFVEAAASDSLEGINFSKDKSKIIKSLENVKHMPLSTTDNPFEFPRQQTDDVPDPAIMQFTASQRLLSPNQTGPSNTPQNEHPTEDTAVGPAVGQNQPSTVQSPAPRDQNPQGGLQQPPTPAIMAEIIVHQVQHKDVNIVCKTGSITRTVADVALVSSTPQYTMDVGAAKAIASAAGQQFEDNRIAAINYARANDESYIIIETDDIPAIPFQAVIVIPVRGRNRSSMRVIYRQAIKAAIDSEFSSVVMPLLGCGGLNIQVNRAAQELLEAILTFSSFGNLTAINFIDLNLQSMERLGELLDTIPDILPNPGPSYGVHPAPAYIPDLPSHNVSAGLSDITVIGENIRSGPVLIPRAEVQFIGTSAPVVNEEDNKIREDEPFKEIPRNEVGNQHDDLNSTQNFPCSICLNDLVVSAGNGEEDSVSLKIDPVVRMSRCTHEFHKSCIETCFETRKRCPLCMRWYAPSIGYQPAGSNMRVKRIPGSPPGHPSADGWFKIKYIIPGGIQTAHHIRPGVPFSGTTRTAFVPNDEGGRHVLNLLRKAFENRHIFTVGDSITTGVQNVPVWVIHHKTSQTGGPANYGFPDPGYYERVTDELAEVGITRESLNN